jgi:hypothetical protein
MSMVVDPGAGHFSFNPELADYVALFIRKAAHCRIRDDGPVLRDLPLESGWLTDSTFMTPSRFAPAPYSEYKGDPSLALWHMDEELARGAEAFGESRKGKLDQRVTFVQDGKRLPAAWLEDVKFEPEQDGGTLKLHAAFVSETPTGVADSGKPLGHAEEPILFRLIGGWMGGGEQVSGNVFRIAPSNFGLPDNLMVLAYHPGDDKYSYTEQPCQIEYPKLLNITDTIDFPAPANVRFGAAGMELHAKSSSGAPVEFYFQSGPAQGESGRVRFVPIPIRTKFPMKVTVVAYEPSRHAEPVTRTFLIEK